MQDQKKDKPEYLESDINFSSGVAAFESREFSRAMPLLSPFAEKGNPEAQYRVAIMYQNGLGVVRNESSAYLWMRQAAEQHLPIAQHGLGFMYLEGDCVQKDPEQALKWFKLAADQGLQGSICTIGMMYKEGLGVEKSLDEAKAWYAKAGMTI